jgi:hypothetical protein
MGCLGATRWLGHVLALALVQLRDDTSVLIGALIERSDWRASGDGCMMQL